MKVQTVKDLLKSHTYTDMHTRCVNKFQNNMPGCQLFSYGSSTSLVQCIRHIRRL